MKERNMVTYNWGQLAAKSCSSVTPGFLALMGLRYLNGSAGSGNGWQGWNCTLLNILGTLLNILGIITVFVRA